MIGRIRSRFGRGGAQPSPADIDEADRRGCLDRSGQGAEDHAEHGPLLLGQGDPGEQEPEHQGIVVGTADQVEDDHRVEDGQGEQLGAVPMVEAGQPGDAKGDQQDAGIGQQPEQHDGGQLVVEGDPGEEAVDLEEERAVGGRSVPPQGVHRRRERVVPQLVGPVEIRVHVMADHLALGRVGVHVPAEQRGDDQHGQGPQPEYPHELAHGYPRAPGIEAGHPPPDPHQQ